jgi:hypothetical protein
MEFENQLLLEVSVLEQKTMELEGQILDIVKQEDWWKLNF